MYTNVALRMNSFYRSNYISTFTVYYPSDATTGGNKTTLIPATCSAVAAVVVVAALAVILIKLRSRKQMSCEQEADNVEQNIFESSNGFSGGLSISHVEEDPFAGDFKEDKFIDQI